MILPTLTPWNAGKQTDETLLNSVSYALNFLLAPPEAKVSQTAAQVIATGTTTATAVTFDTLVKDNDGMWNAATPTFLTVQTPGWYEAEWAVSWATKADTTIRLQCLYTNGAFAIAKTLCYNDYVNNSGTTPQVWMSYDLFLNAGDTVSLGLMQGSGANLSTASSASLKDQQTFLRLRWASF
jgi:hypothetical protein